MTTDLEPNTIIVMRILRSIGENNQANEMMEKFNKSSEMIAGQNYLKNRNYLEEIKENSGRYEVENGNQFSVLRLWNSDLFR
jgi:hypothetical protein